MIHIVKVKENLLKIKRFGFAIKIVNLYKYLCDERKEFALSKQILRSGTSVGAMICGIEYSENKTEFIHKKAVVQQEINETIYWLELLCETEYIPSKEFENINADAIELIKIIIASINTVKSKINH
jgi:four helix bundle protein